MYSVRWLHHRAFRHLFSFDVQVNRINLALACIATEQQMKTTTITAPTSIKHRSIRMNIETEKIYIKKKITGHKHHSTTVHFKPKEKFSMPCLLEWELQMNGAIETFLNVRLIKWLPNHDCDDRTRIYLHIWISVVIHITSTSMNGHRIYKYPFLVRCLIISMQIKFLQIDIFFCLFLSCKMDDAIGFLRFKNA